MNSQQKPSYVINIYIEATQEELECKMENQKLPPFNNLTKGERTALKELNERDDIVITEADNVGAVVIIDVKDYTREAECQLKNKDNYDRLNPLSANFTNWSNTLKQFVGNFPTNCLSVFDHFVGLAFKGLNIIQQKQTID